MDDTFMNVYGCTYLERIYLTYFLFFIFLFVPLYGKSIFVCFGGSWVVIHDSTYVYLYRFNMLFLYVSFL